MTDSTEVEADTFNPGWRLLAAFTSFAIVNLACAIDATSVSVALPVISSLQTPPFSFLTNQKADYLRCTSWHSDTSIMDRNCFPSGYHSLATYLHCLLTRLRPSTYPPHRPYIIHYRSHNVRCVKEHNSNAGRTSNTGKWMWRDTYFDRGIDHRSDSSEAKRKLFCSDWCCVGFR